ncbi:MAG: hypothetical protein IV101_00240 [Dechloromonas sp.]|uniref:hypothetical protein n=1 Tax=Dechloromonas sp. TaxID=1917218 RepID=UPI0027E71E1C|nr:hypothetical protein [Dechloromonas sp.]MBT9519294.1 hypothetical protein [Dechloromonas sp.]
MISVYKPIGSEGYELCQPAVSSDFLIISSMIHGDPLEGDRLPLMQIIREDEKGKEYLRSDAPWLGGHALVFRDSVSNNLKELLGSAKLYEFTCDSERLVLCDPPVVENAVIQDQSEIDRFSDGRIMQIRNYVFNPATLRDRCFFKINEMRVSPTFVTQEFVDFWVSNKFVGLDFNLLWTAK